jgi:hypothetical protein
MRRKGKVYMKRTRKTFGGMVASLLFAACAFAGTESKGQLKIAETVTVGSQEVRTGTYQVEWTGSGSNVELRIMDRWQTVSKVPAQLVALKRAEAGDGYSTNTEPSGNKTLAGIFFRGKKYELSIGAASAVTTTPSGKSDARN